MLFSSISGLWLGKADSASSGRNMALAHGICSRDQGFPYSKLISQRLHVHTNEITGLTRYSSPVPELSPVTGCTAPIYGRQSRGRLLVACVVCGWPLETAAMCRSREIAMLVSNGI